jgi:hypothetical protein
MVKIAPLEGFSQLISDFTGNPHSPVPLPERFFWAEKRYIYKAHINGTSSDVFHSNKTYSSILLKATRNFLLYFLHKNSCLELSRFQIFTTLRGIRVNMYLAKKPKFLQTWSQKCPPAR